MSSSARCANFRARAVLPSDLARGDCCQLGAQHVAIAAACPERISRPRVCDHGDDELVDDDAFDAGAGIASQTWSPRTIGAMSGVLSSSTAFFWLWANWTGRLPEPARERSRTGSDRSAWRSGGLMQVPENAPTVLVTGSGQAHRPGDRLASVGSGLSRRDPLRHFRKRGSCDRRRMRVGATVPGRISREWMRSAACFSEVEERLGTLYGLVNNAARFQRVAIRSR